MFEVIYFCNGHTEGVKERFTDFEKAYDLAMKYYKSCRDDDTLYLCSVDKKDIETHLFVNEGELHYIPTNEITNILMNR